MVPLLIAAGSGLASAGLGAWLGSREASRQAAEQARREKYNQMMSAVDTRYQAFGLGNNAKYLQEAPATLTQEGAIGNAVLGGLQQGMNVYGGLSAMENNSQIADALRNKFNQTNGIPNYQGASAGLDKYGQRGWSQNAYSQMPRLGGGY